MNLPNGLTVLRILLVPVVVAALLDKSDSADVIAAAAFAVAGTTDWFDGYIARSRQLITTFGKVMDPIADKLLITATLVTLSAQGRLSWWVTSLVLGREFAVTALRAAMSGDGRVISASQYGKLKTVLQMVAVLVVILVDPGTFVDVVVWSMVAVTIATGVDYFVNMRKRVDPAV